MSIIGNEIIEKWILELAFAERTTARRKEFVEIMENLEKRTDTVLVSDILNVVKTLDALEEYARS